MSKRVIAFSAFFASLFLSFAQKTNDVWKDFDARMDAIHNPIIVKTPNDSCYLEQHLYQDGSLFFEVPVINGKRNGIYKEYYPNGQLRQQYEMEDGHKRDSTIEIVYNRNGDYDYIVIYLTFRNKHYACSTQYPVNMFFHEIPKYRIVAEYTFEEGKWKKRPYHVKPVRFANRLFRTYRKEWRKKLPDVDF